MNTKEHFESQKQLYNIYTGILRNNPIFSDGLAPEFHYEFDCPEYNELKEIYHLSDIAGKGTDFERARRLCHHFAPRLKHKGDYDGHITANSLALLDYCYEKEDVGINCLYKSKILAECCMALGIYARRVHIMPYSPYDMDNHVDTEIFDRKLNKWILLDVTNDCYYIDDHGTPLNMMEVRNKMMQLEPCTCVFWRQVPNTKKLMHNSKNVQLNSYTAKNMFWFKIDSHSSFGIKGEQYHFLPHHFDVKKNNLDNLDFKLKYLEEYHLDPGLRKYLLEIKETIEQKTIVTYSIEHVWDSPII